MGVRVGGGLGPVRGSVRVGVPRGANRAANGLIAVFVILPVWYCLVLTWLMFKWICWSGPVWCVRRWQARSPRP